MYDELGSPDPDLIYQKAFELKPGERRGWWTQHPNQEYHHSVASVRGAVCNHRIPILLDSGSTTSILSLDLARRLKLKLDCGERLKVKGIGGVTTYITSTARVKVTLGVSVVYYTDIWVGNIGEGVDCLLGMNFMVAAGVRLSSADGNVHLPDEERIPLIGTPAHPRIGLDMPVKTSESTDIHPGFTLTVHIRYGKRNPAMFELWVGRGRDWLTTVVTNAASIPTSIRVVNVTRNKLRLPAYTCAARLVEQGYLPERGTFVRVGSPKYSEWEQQAYESTFSRDYRRRLEYSEYI